MRIKKGRREVEEGDMTPMIDMVFQLIAFFMVLVNFSDAESAEHITLPYSEIAQAPSEEMENAIYVHMKKDSDVTFSGKTVSIDAILDELRGEAKRIIKADDMSLSETTVIVRADENGKTGDVQKLMEHCRTAGFSTFALRVTEGEDKRVNNGGG